MRVFDENSSVFYQEPLPFSPVADDTNAFLQSPVHGFEDFVMISRWQQRQCLTSSYLETPSFLDDVLWILCRILSPLWLLVVFSNPMIISCSQEVFFFLLLLFGGKVFLYHCSYNYNDLYLLYEFSKWNLVIMHSKHW